MGTSTSNGYRQAHKTPTTLLPYIGPRYSTRCYSFGPTDYRRICYFTGMSYMYCLRMVVLLWPQTHQLKLDWRHESGSPHSRKPKADCYNPKIGCSISWGGRLRPHLNGECYPLHLGAVVAYSSDTRAFEERHDR
jgi:hypothetical protein